MYYGVVYFAGPKTRWGLVSNADHQLEARIHADEIIACTPALPWRGLARWQLLSAFRPLAELSRCGYALMQGKGEFYDAGDECLEQYDPPLEPIEA